MSNQFDRTIGLIGERNFSSIQSKTILIAGIGGVGGTCFEALLRTGFKHFIIIDKDDVDISNLNRQVLFINKDVGVSKVEAAKEKALSINKDIDIICHKTKIDNNFSKLISTKVDFIVDCVDDINAKKALVSYANENNIPVISSLGMANKLEPSLIKVGLLNKATVDPLGKKFRYALKQSGIDFSKLMVVYSTEIPHKDGTKLNSIITVTSTAGLYICNYVVSYFIKME